MGKTLLFDADLKTILNSIPPGGTIERKIASGSMVVNTIVKQADGNYMMSNGRPISEKTILTDIANRRILISSLIAAAEKAGNLEMEIDLETGKTGIYNRTLEDMSKCKRAEFGSDALILFAETFDAKEVKDLNILQEGPIKLSSYVYNKIRSLNRGHGHHYTDEELQQVKAQLETPLAVIRTRTKDGGAAVAVLTKARDYKGNLSLVIIAPDEANGDNYITSIYGKENGLHYLLMQQEKGTVTYISPNLLSDLGDSISTKDKEIAKEILRHEKEKSLKKKTSLGAIRSTVTGRRAEL